MMPSRSGDEAGQEIVRLREQLNETQRAMQDFIYSVSHDLGVPLRAVASFSSILQKKYAPVLDQKGLTYLGFVTDGGTRAQMMLAGLLQYSRIYTHAQPFARVDAMVAANAAIYELESRAHELKAKITCEGMPVVHGDAAQIQMLLSVLIDNALTYRRMDAPPHIDIVAEDAGEFWQFTVTDNGIGIPPERVEFVFHVFKRLHGEEIYPGVGMGLPIAQRIVERHGGTIGLRQARPFGTVAWFTLPKSP